MITTRDIEALGFILDDKYGSFERWLYEFESCAMCIEFMDYGKLVFIHIYEAGYEGSIELKGEVTLERIEKLIEALR